MLYKSKDKEPYQTVNFRFSNSQEMSNDNNNDNHEKPLGVFNPNQRQFFEDELRYREKLQQLHAGLGESRFFYRFLMHLLSFFTFALQIYKRIKKYGND